MTDRTENDALIQYATEHAKPDTILAARGDADHVAVAYVPKGMGLHSLKPFLDQYLPAPERRKGSTQLADIDSFCAFVERHKGDATVIFATPGDHPSLTCVFDHDPAGPTAAGWAQHRATYTFPLSSQWLAWRKAHGEAVSQTAFALFIEERSVDLIDRPTQPPAPPLDVLSPADAPATTPTEQPELPEHVKIADRMGLVTASPLEVIRASRGLRLRAEVNVNEAVVIESGETEVSFAEKHTGQGGEKLTVPSAFFIGIPVFRDEPLDVVLVRLRYRRQDQRIAWTPSMHAPDDLLAYAFKTALDRVREATKVPVFLGSAPAERA